MTGLGALVVYVLGHWAFVVLLACPLVLYYRALRKKTKQARGKLVIAHWLVTVENCILVVWEYSYLHNKAKKTTPQIAMVIILIIIVFIGVLIMNLLWTRATKSWVTYQNELEEYNEMMPNRNNYNSGPLLS